MKKLISFFVFIVFVAGSFVTSVSAASFSDISPSHRFYREMMYLQGEGIIQGFPDGTFRPNGEVTRAAAAIMIGRALGLNGEQRETTFTDVGANQAASGYIASAAEREIIQGYPDGTFRPYEPVTRGQMAIFLSRAFALTVDGYAPFTDISAAMASYVHIKRIVAEHIAHGYPDNTFRPNEKVTRAQFSAFLARALNDAFKVELPISFLKEKDRLYYYEVVFEDQVSVFRHVYSYEDYPGWNLWYVFDDTDVTHGYSLVERQDHEGLKSGPPYSEYQLDLAFPLEVGRSWNIEFVDEILNTYVIIGVDRTVSTPAGTFTGVVEVEDSYGWVNYYAPNAGLIKRIDEEGRIMSQLVRIENR